MGENSAIEWADHTFNPWSGCAKVSPGCANCYAEALARRFLTLGDWGPGAERKRTSEANWRKPLAWNRAAGKAACRVCGKPATCFGVYENPAGQAPAPACDSCCGHGCEDGWCKPIASLRPRVFCASLADWLDPEVPAEWLADLLALIAATPNLDWLLLTKRPRLWRERIGAAAEAAWREYDNGDLDPPAAFDMAEAWLNRREAPANVWLGTTVEDQQRADERLPLLLQIPARIRFLSCEPLLGPVDLTERWSLPSSMTVGAGLQTRVNWSPGIQWVICGGESGPGARPMHPAWAEDLRDQCEDAGVAFFFKQWGEWVPIYARDSDPDARNLPTLNDRRRWLNAAGGHGFHGERVYAMSRVGKHAAGRELDGRTWDEVPA